MKWVIMDQPEETQANDSVLSHGIVWMVPGARVVLTNDHLMTMHSLTAGSRIQDSFPLRDYCHYWATLSSSLLLTFLLDP